MFVSRIGVTSENHKQRGHRDEREESWWTGGDSETDIKTPEGSEPKYVWDDGVGKLQYRKSVTYCETFSGSGWDLFRHFFLGLTNPRPTQGGCHTGSSSVNRSECKRSKGFIIVYETDRAS